MAAVGYAKGDYWRLRFSSHVIDKEAYQVEPAALDSHLAVLTS